MAALEIINMRNLKGKHVVLIRELDLGKQQEEWESEENCRRKGGEKFGL